MIPLAPLGLSEILGGAFSTIGRYWKPLVGLALALFGAVTALMVAGVAVVLSALAANWDELTAPGTPDTEELVPLAVAFGALVIIGGIAYLLAWAVIQAAVPVTLQEAVLGRPIRFGALWRRAWSRVWSMIGTTILLGLIFAVPFLLFMVTLLATLVTAAPGGDSDGVVPLIWLSALGWLAAVPAAIWLWVKFSLAPTVVVFEKQGPVAALRRSAQLVRTDWWRVFGISLLAYVMATVAGYLIQMPFQILGLFPSMMSTPSTGSEPSGAEILALVGSFIGLSLISQLVAQLFSAVFPPLVVGLLYVDRRMRTENLGPVLAAAAAEQPLPEQYGPPPGAPA
ncbi:hypothetical protein RM717_14825 [Streptomyces griseus]|uniref:DUF7847 domain-containing protein n=1 Tax=Streptomyces stephensoniae TaxID=3375367 RepID=A0ABU2W1P7_9ACTN|nr:hypothetical protein [Streptomyces griseus]MDT0491782.1 hypothetical protein [Streptomyces griseus]